MHASVCMNAFASRCITRKSTKILLLSIDFCANLDEHPADCWSKVGWQGGFLSHSFARDSVCVCVRVCVCLCVHAWERERVNERMRERASE